MVKCVVSGCPNRLVNYNRGIFSRPPRRFFRFPKEPDRVKVWLAALREMDKDVMEQHIICEDHFLPDDIKKSGVSSDATPLMPLGMDRTSGLMRSWAAESPEEDEPWGARGCSEDDQEDPAGGLEASPEAETDSVSQQTAERSCKVSRPGTPLSLLTRGLLELILMAPDSSVDLQQAAASLQAPARQICRIASVLADMDLVWMESDSRIWWTGNSSICSFLWRDPLKLLSTVQRLKTVEAELDELIRSCSQQLFDLTDAVENAAWAYVTYEDMAGLRDFWGRTLIFIRTPQETKLHIPEPGESNIKVHLVAEKGPISALTCEVAAGHPESRAIFSLLEDSRVRMSMLEPK